MALVVEDGTGLVDSNTYVSLEDAREYASDRGVDLGTDENAESMLLRAMDYIESFRDRFKGRRSFPDHPQALQWPRTGVEIDCIPLEDDVIPVELRRAQSRAAMEINAGFDPLAPSDGRAVKRQKVDVIEREFMTPTDMGLVGLAEVTLPAVDALLGPLLRPIPRFRTRRA